MCIHLHANLKKGLFGFLHWLVLKNIKYKKIKSTYLQADYGESGSRSVVSNSLGPPGLYSPWNSPGQNIGLGSLSLLQVVFPTQESNQGLLYCRWILNQLSYQGSPKNTGVGCDFLLQGIFPTQESHLDLPHCRRILYPLSYKGSPNRLWFP